jgi:hypothetical protein
MFSVLVWLNAKPHSDGSKPTNSMSGLIARVSTRFVETEKSRFGPTFFS